MRLIRSARTMQNSVRRMRQSGKKIALVPTMGALHEGHLALVRRARRQADVVVVSIFVNPTQFAPREDLAKYPRDLARDKKLLAGEGVDLIFAPSAAEIYPPDFDTDVVPGDLASRLEGKFRPDHFRGVATVVLKLFNIVQPDLAVFGRKDLQQSVVIKRMVVDLNLPVNVLVAPTVRDRDGLALSSRNAYLSVDARQRALAISGALRSAREQIAGGERSATRIRTLIRKRLEGVGAVIDYISVAEPQRLTELTRIKGEVAISLACTIEGVRLIDNVTMKVK
ncbi:MAG: pantoate--beta-alanine ligase [bacterium]